MLHLKFTKMKKLFLLLFAFLSLASYGQQETEKLKITENLNSPTAPNVNVQEADGVVNYRPISSMPYAQADTGVLTFAGLTTNSATTINIGAVNGQIVDNETNPLAPVRTSVAYAGATGVTVTTVGSGSASYVMLSSAGAISFQNTFPTSAERKAKIWLGKVAHPAGSVTLVVNEPDYVTSPLALTRDWIQDIGPFINNGVFPYSNGANLNINVTGGAITGDGINFVTSRTNPNHIDVLPALIANFGYRTQNGGATAAVNLISPGFYDNAGTITAVGGGAGSTTIQHVEYTPGQGYIIQYGQTVYSTFAEAVAAVGKETFIRWSNLVNNAIPIGVIVVNKTATALNNTAQAMFFKASKTGDFFGAQAGVSTGTLQSTYLNSVVPQIVTTAGLGALTVKRGSGLDTDNILVGQNGAGSTTFSVTGAGVLSASNKQNSLNIDGTGVNFPTVDAINAQNKEYKRIRNAPYYYPSWYNGIKIPVSIKNETAVYNYDVQNEIDINSYVPYFLSPTGLDANDGLTTSTPKLTLTSARTAGARLVYMLPGIYKQNSFLNTDMNLSGQDLVLIGIGDVNITTASQTALTWVLSTSNTYRATRSNVFAVIDASMKNKYGWFKDLTQVASQALCEATSGTWYTDNVGVWIHNYDNRVPDANDLALLNVTNSIKSDTGIVYMENLKMYAIRPTIWGLTSASQLKVYMKNVIMTRGKTSVSATMNGFDLDIFRTAILQDCQSYESQRDGFNYHNILGFTDVNVVEINCKSFNANHLPDATVNNQSSSWHEGIRGLRIGCSYYGGSSQIVADVTAGTQSILVGCEFEKGEDATTTKAFEGVDADLFGCKFNGNLAVNAYPESIQGVTLTNCTGLISGSTGTVIINN